MIFIKEINTELPQGREVDIMSSLIQIRQYLSTINLSLSETFVSITKKKATTLSIHSIIDLINVSQHFNFILVLLWRLIILYVPTSLTMTLQNSVSFLLVLQGILVTIAEQDPNLSLNPETYVPSRHKVWTNSNNNVQGELKFVVFYISHYSKVWQSRSRP